MRLFPWVGTGWSAALRDHAKASLQPRGLRQRVVLKLGLDDTPSDPTSQLVMGQAATGDTTFAFYGPHARGRVRRACPTCRYPRPTDRLAELRLLVRADAGDRVGSSGCHWLACHPSRFPRSFSSAGYLPLVVAHARVAKQAATYR